MFSFGSIDFQMFFGVGQIRWCFNGFHGFRHLYFRSSGSRVDTSMHRLIPTKARISKIFQSLRHFLPGVRIHGFWSDFMVSRESYFGSSGSQGRHLRIQSPLYYSENLENISKSQTLPARGQNPCSAEFRARARWGEVSHGVRNFRIDGYIDWFLL